MFSRFSGKPKSPKTSEAEAPLTSNAPQQGKRVPVDTNRPRSLAACIANPRKMMEEYNGARYDLDTIRSFARKPPGHAGMMALQALHGGAWTIEEAALWTEIQNCSEVLEISLGRAKQCVSDAQHNGHPGYDDEVRGLANHWLTLLRCWDDYTRHKGRTALKRAAEMLGAPFIGLF